MFTNLIFLILFLLVVNLAPEASPGFWNASPELAFTEGIVLYAAVLLLIAVQNRLVIRLQPQSRGMLHLLAQFQLISFFLVYHFVLVAHRLYMGQSQLLFSLVSLAMYFIGLGVHHAACFTPRLSFYRGQSRWSFAGTQLRFILPFVIPFLCFELLFDFLNFIPYEPLQQLLRHQGDPLLETLLFTGTTVVFLILLLIFLPAAIQYLWGCQPLQNAELTQRLEAVCARAGFKHAGMKRWTVLRNSHTAAIIGIVPRFRYVMFTDGLVQRLSPEEVEAVLAHEIGHSYRKHLIIYPFIILGLVMSTGLFSLFFLDPIFEHMALREQLGSEVLWQALRPFVIFIPFALIAVLYFRLVFGLFSRNFERQADLHPLQLGIPAEYMISALHNVAVASGEPPNKPNWHHYSIRERIQFLQKADHHPDLVKAHHRHVRRLLLIYFTVLTIASTVVVSPLLPDLPITKQVGQWVEDSTRSLSHWFNGGLRRQTAAMMVERYQLQGDRELIRDVLEAVLETDIAIYLPGIAEFLAAQQLNQLEEYRAAIVLMGYSWLRFDFTGMGQEVIDDFDSATQDIMRNVANKEIYSQELRFLLDSIENARQRIEKGPHAKREISDVQLQLLRQSPLLLSRQ